MAIIAPTLRFNMSGASSDPAIESGRYQAALDMAEFAERHDFGLVNVEEHHGTEIGWLGSPLTLAGLILGRTQRIPVRAMAVLVTLYDPIRLAEDIALLDLASRGRLTVVMGQGYRPVEYHMMDRDWEARGDAIEHVIDTLLKAWTGETFEYRGKPVQVRPRPFSRPTPPITYGGMSRPAARRAAKLGLAFQPAQPMPELADYYLAECARFGTQGQVINYKDMSLVFVDEDPDQAWRELGPYFLTEVEEYSSWARQGVERHYSVKTQSVDDLRGRKVFEILTPQECLARAAASIGPYEPILHPLAGGIPVERAWRSLEIFRDKVLAKQNA
jgi:alkanesulfonate monooxygenase SsuD/methylene tetrahydromethanopterin reductase-like flavin-dependent oxidoreductase (luciferase family)